MAGEFNAETLFEEADELAKRLIATMDLSLQPGAIAAAHLKVAASIIASTDPGESIEKAIKVHSLYFEDMARNMNKAKLEMDGKAENEEDS
jgi:hypothetical protein